MSNKKEKEKVIRAYNWCFECYENPVEKLKDLPLQICVGPLHDKDLKEDGSLKKPHYHCIVHYDNAVSLNRVNKDILNISANNHFEPVSSKTAYEEYLTHTDGQSMQDDNKMQYDKKDIVCLGGYTLGFCSKSNHTEQFTCLYDLFIEYCSDVAVDSNGEISVSMLSFSGFVRNKNPDMIYFLMKNSYFINSLIKEMGEKNERRKSKKSNS